MVQKRIENIRTIYKKAEFFEKRSGVAAPLSQRFFRKLCRTHEQFLKTPVFEDQVRDILEHDTRARPECYEDMSLNL